MRAMINFLHKKICFWAQIKKNDEAYYHRYEKNIPFSFL